MELFRLHKTGPWTRMTIRLSISELLISMSVNGLSGNVSFSEYFDLRMGKPLR